MGIPGLKNPYPDLDALGERCEHNPAHLAIEPTSVCNTKCVFCGHYYENTGRHMDAEVFEIVRTSMLDDATSADLTGYGEPLIAKQFHPMLEECTRRGMDLSFTTNGIRLRKDEVVAPLVRRDILMRVSIDGARAETFEFARPYIKWDDMIRTLECLKSNCDAAGPEKRIRLTIHFVAMKKNIGDLPDMVRLAHKYGFDHLKILPLGLSDLYEPIRDQALDDRPDLVEEPLLEALSLGTELGVHLEVPPAFREMVRRRQARGATVIERVARKAAMGKTWLKGRGVGRAIQVAVHGLGPKAKTGITYCTMPWKETYIGATGEIYACCRLSQKLGNLKTQSWADIWNGAAYRNLRRTIHSWNPTRSCRECHIWCGIYGGDDHHYRRVFDRYRKETVELDDPCLSFGDGFHELERTPEGAPTHRWIDKTATFRIPMRPGAKFLGLLVIPDRDDSRLNPGKAVVNGRDAEPFDNTCDEIHLPIDGEKAGTLAVSLEMENAFKFGEDPRSLALAVRGIRFLFEPETTSAK